MWIVSSGAHLTASAGGPQRHVTEPKAQPDERYETAPTRASFQGVPSRASRAREKLYKSQVYGRTSPRGLVDLESLQHIGFVTNISFVGPLAAAQGAKVQSRC